MKRKTRSKVEELGAKELVENLFEANATYDDIIRAVHQATGKTLSDSALSRYRERWSSAKARLEQAAKEAEAIVKVLTQHPEGNLADAGMGLLLGKLVRRFASAEEAFETADLLELGHLLVKASRAQQHKQALGIQQERLELMQHKVEAVAERVKERATAAGASPEQVAAMVDDILGVAA